MNDRIRTDGIRGPSDSHSFLVWPDLGVLTVQLRKGLMNCFSLSAISGLFLLSF